MGIAAIPIALTAASTAIAATAAISNANAQSKAAAYNAQLAENNAIIMAQQGQQDKEAVLQQGQMIQGKARAAAAASGLGTGGSAEDVSYANLLNNEHDALSAQYRATVEGYNSTNQANLDRASSSNATTSGYMSAGGTLLSGAAQSYNYANYSKSTPYLS